MERTLYLSEKKGVEVRRDGPSLWVKERTRAGYRIPARLLDMVVVIGNIKMDAGVVTLFSENNVPVSFLNIRGETVAIAMPYHNPGQDRRDEQRRFFRIAGNPGRFEGWFHARKRRVQLYVASRLEYDTAKTFAENGFRELDYWELMRRHTRTAEGPWRTAREGVSGFLREMIVERLIKAGLDPHLGVLHKRCDFGFAMDLGEIMEPEADMQAVRFVRDRNGAGLFVEGTTKATLTKEGMKELVKRFEARKKSVGNHLDSVIDSLFELFRDYGEAI